METGSKENRTEKRLAAVVDGLLETADGRFFLAWLMDASGLFSAEFTESIARAEFREGSRAVGAAIFALVRKSPLGSNFMMEDK